jgi:ribosomal protein S4
MTNRVKGKFKIYRKKLRRRGKLTTYGKLLIEKQKLRCFYSNVKESQLKQIYNKSNNDVKPLAKFVECLECRVDTILYRSRLVPSFKSARQLINHGDVSVNGKIIKEAGFSVKEGSLISINSRKRGLILRWMLDQINNSNDEKDKKKLAESLPSSILVNRVGHYLSLVQSNGLQFVSKQGNQGNQENQGNSYLKLLDNNSKDFNLNNICLDDLDRISDKALLFKIAMYSKDKSLVLRAFEKAFGFSGQGELIKDKSSLKSLMSNVTNSSNSSLSSLTGGSKYLGTGGGSIVSMLLKEMNSSSTKGGEFNRSGPIGDFDNKLKIVYESALNLAFFKLKPLQNIVVDYKELRCIYYRHPSYNEVTYFPFKINLKKALEFYGY